MYDLEIALPVCLSKDNYRKRFEDFKKYGLFNVKGKVHLSLICDPGVEVDLSGFDGNLDISILEATTTHVASKTAYYYSVLRTDQLDVMANWYMRLDDDSITDISGLIDKLNSEVNKPLYLVSGLNKNLFDIEKLVLNEFGVLQDNLKFSDPRIWHEWECCVVNQLALNKMYDNPLSRKMFVRRSEIKNGVNDQFLGCVLLMSGVYAVDCNYLSPDPHLGHLNCFEGGLVHIHYMSHDTNSDLYDIFKRYIDKSKPEGRKFFDKIKNKKFNFSIHEKSIARLLGKLIFKENGVIEREEASGLRESFWNDSTGRILTYNEIGDIISCYDRLPNGEFICVFDSDGKVFHKLELF